MGFWNFVKQEKCEEAKASRSWSGTKASLLSLTGCVAQWATKGESFVFKDKRRVCSVFIRHCLYLSLSS